MRLGGTVPFLTGQCPNLLAAYRYSELEMRALGELFEANAARLPAIETLAVGGSLGRLEASSASDVDCIIVLKDGVDVAQASEQLKLVFSLFERSPFKLPKPDGIYRQGIARSRLLDAAALGRLDEAPEVFGKRIQILLDARPLFGQANFALLQRDVLAWYASDFLVARPSRGWTYLCNDLMRYLHSYAGWQQYKFERSADDSWQLRQAKFRSSRVLTFAAMMCLLGESDAREDKLEWLESHLAKTPLERLHAVMGRHDPAAYERVLLAYEACHAALAQPEVRHALVTTGPDADSRMNTDFHPMFEDIRTASATLLSTLTEFALARRADWGSRFFERWLF